MDKTDPASRRRASCACPVALRLLDPADHLAGGIAITGCRAGGGALGGDRGQFFLFGGVAVFAGAAWGASVGRGATRARGRSAGATIGFAFVGSIRCCCQALGRGRRLFGVLPFQGRLVSGLQWLRPEAYWDHGFRSNSFMPFLELSITLGFCHRCPCFSFSCPVRRLQGWRNFVNIF